MLIFAYWGSKESIAGVNQGPILLTKTRLPEGIEGPKGQSHPLCFRIPSMLTA